MIDSMPDDVVARTTVTQRALEEIKRMIAAGELGPGERLPAERELAASLGLSRSAMREAIRALTVLGVLEPRHGAGVYVTALEPKDLLDTFGVVAEISRGDNLLHLVQVRRILEPAAAATAAARIGDADLGRLREAMSRMEAGATAEEIVGFDLEFHRVITEAAGNPVLSAILDGLNSRTFRARVWRGYRVEGVFERTFAEHARIYRAFIDRDPEGARTAAAAHIGAVEEWLRAQSGEIGAPPHG